MKSKQIIIGHFLTLITGSGIYILFRVKTLKMFTWFSYLHLNKEIDLMRKQVIKIQLVDWIKYSLPDGLWMFSYISLILFLWNNQLKMENMFWILSIPIIAIFSEILQAFYLLQGTFDTMDLLMYLLGSILPFIFYKRSITVKHKKL